MRSAILISFVMSLACLVYGQQAPPEPACNSYVIQKTVNEHPETFSGKQRLCTYGAKLVSGQAFFGPTFLGGVAQLRNDPVEWGQGTKGYLRRVGSRYSQGVAKSTGEFVFSYVLREDPLYRPSANRHFWNRTGHALASVFVVDHLDRSHIDGTPPKRTRWPAFSKLAGASSSGLVGLAWYPDRLNTPGQVMARTGSAYGGYVASALFSEFQADIFRFLGKIVGSDRGSPSSKLENTKEPR